MQIKLLNEIVAEIVGKQASEILDLLFDKKDVNEFLIAKKMKLTINQVRNILYKLSNYNLVSFTRKKDKRKGWYTYFWTLNTEKSLELLSERLKKEMEGLQQQLKSREQKRFYLCNTCKTEVSEETALLHDFTCQECGEVYVLSDKKRVVENLTKDINRLERQRQSVLDELVKIKEEGAKKRDKIAKKLKKKQKEKRKAGKKVVKKSKKKARKKARKKPRARKRRK